MKKIISCMLLIFVLLLLGACSSKEDSRRKDDETPGKYEKYEEDNSFADLLYSTIGTDGVKVEIGEIEYGSRAKVTVHIPDYTSLFLTASKASDPTEALIKAIESENYTTTERYGYADVIYNEKGEPVVQSEEFVKSLIEEELIKAVNAVSEGDVSEE